MNHKICKLAQKVGQALKKKKLLIATAESCTGGMLAAAITDVPGSSAYFERGFVTYSNLAKIEHLSVKKATIKNFNAVSEQVAREMALGVLKVSRAQVSVAITGVAGPTGGTKSRPKGMVCFALAYKGAEVKTITTCFRGNRDGVRQQAVEFALKWLLLEI
jgi:nicotinamide-nucleotide amidase